VLPSNNRSNRPIVNYLFFKPKKNNKTSFLPHTFFLIPIQNDEKKN